MNRSVDSVKIKQASRGSIRIRSVKANGLDIIFYTLLLSGLCAAILFILCMKGGTFGVYFELWRVLLCIPLIILATLPAQLLRELRTESGGNQNDRAFEIVDGFKIVLFDIDGVHRAGHIAATAIDTTVRVENGMPVLDMDGTGGAYARAVGAADTKIVLEFQRVVEIFRHVERLKGMRDV